MTQTELLIKSLARNYIAFVYFIILLSHNDTDEIISFA